MAWVRPRHPKKKEPVDPTESLVPILSFFSGQRHISQPSPPKIIQKPLQDPILQNLRQAQIANNKNTVESRSRKTASRKPRTEPRQDEESDEGWDDCDEESAQRTVSRHHAKILSSPPPPPQPAPPAARPRPRPRPVVYEHPVPMPVARDRYVPYAVPVPLFPKVEASRALSSRWASATTPLNL
ncbi:MAG: hypothetical protein Q9190_000204 [Brigantiaea leucoxantha]